MDGAVHTFKSRLVAKGFTQTYGVDYEETFSPVADIRAIRILIAIAAFYDYEIWQMDVKTAFLNGHLFEEVYMTQPEGFVNPKYPNHVCKLKRSIYGLKQASRQWNKRFDDEIKKFGFTQNQDEPCVYLKASRSYVTFLILYVDDILIMGNNIPMLQDVKSYLGKCFAMKDLGEAAYILGIKIYRDRSKRLIGLCQSAYIEKILKRYYMENSKRGTIPMQEKLKLSKSDGASTPTEKRCMSNIPYALAVGSIMYVTTVKNILKYLWNTKDMFLVYGGDMKRELRVSCYTDAGYLTDVDDLKSQARYVFVLNGGVVDWNSTKQSISATLSTDVEYIAAFDSSKEAVWIHIFIFGLNVVPTIEEPITMYCDNTGAIAIANDHGVTKGARHFRAKVHYLRETIKLGDARIEKVDTYDNLADPFTKALAFPKHSELTRKTGLIPSSSLIELTKLLLTNAAFVHLKHLDVSKHTQDLSPASRSILLKDMLLAKALSHKLETKLLMLDIVDFFAKIQNNYGAFNLASPSGVSNYPFDELVFLQELHKVLVTFSKTNGIILYIKDVKRFLKSPRTYELFDILLKILSGSILVLGSEISTRGNVNENISCLFPYNIVIKPPKDKSRLKYWNEQLEEQKKKIRIRDNKNHITEVLEAHKLECNELGSICQADIMLISTYMQVIVVSAISHHLMSHKDPEYRNGKLVISSASHASGHVFRPGPVWGCDNNEYEKLIRRELIPAKEITVTFDDIGALNEIKESLQELVMLPLKRPDLFNGGLLKPCRGVLLFGPPGTGKTMLAKAIAKKAGASFINISASTITSMRHGEDEKNVRTVLSLAAKVSPTIIFLDEVDSMLEQRTRGEHLLMKLKNEFMTHWDGLLTKPGERILVLAATNRPFDLDEAIIRRIMVGLPYVESRESILKTLLAKEKVENLEFKELAVMTEGYSGSDLKQERQKAIDTMKNEEAQALEKKKSEETQATGDAKDTKEESKNVIKLRHLNMEDMMQAKNQVAASLDEGYVGSIMSELK
ncbi:retrotransposon protein, putative, ty1-copia subclass [Tanacetum coccineum]